MIDTHTHILPGVDDGSLNLEESLEMARVAVADGITHMFATPHHRDYTSLSRQEVTRRVAKLQAKLDAAHIPLTLLPGHEVRLYADMFEDWEGELAGPLGHSRYVLAEPLFHQYTAHTDAMLFELFDRGYIPIMAHPERIRPIQEKLSLIEPFLARQKNCRRNAAPRHGAYHCLGCAQTLSPQTNFECGPSVRRRVGRRSTGHGAGCHQPHGHCQQ